MSIAIETKGLTKIYGALTAANHISSEVQEDKVFAFLGPNDAGKTTTIRLLTGLSRPTAGSARILGIETWRPPCALPWSPPHRS
jgi:ABC-2 type transport system ATP-binding protein